MEFKAFPLAWQWQELENVKADFQSYMITRLVASADMLCAYV